MKRSYWIALAVLLVVAAWLLTGRFAGDREAVDGRAVAAPERQPMRVRVVESVAESVTQEVVIHGTTAPTRQVTLKAETAGRVAELPAARGTAVRAGEVVVRLDPENREAQLAEARALVDLRRLEYRAVQSLRKQGLQEERQLAEAKALLESARAQLQGIELDLRRTAIRSPFDAVLDTRAVEVGDYVSVADPVATVAQLDPFIVTGQVSEQQIGLLRTGGFGTARIVGGQSLKGVIRYIGALADPATRTFTVELEVPNPEGRRLAGVTADIRVPVAELRAHRLPASVLTLGESGNIGVKAVDASGVVRHHQGQIVRATPEFLWLSGLPERLLVVVVGQGFVQPGEQVQPVFE